MSLVYGVGWRDETKTLLDELRDTFFKNGQFRFISEDEAEKHKKKDFKFISGLKVSYLPPDEMASLQ